MQLERMREQLDQPKLALTMNAKRGYHFSINAKLISTGKLGVEFIQVQATGKVVRFSTNALSELNSRVNESLVEIWQLTDRELALLLDVIWAKDTVSALHCLCDSIALLDAMTALVSYCSLSPVATVRPVFTDGGPIAVKSGHHPILVTRSPHDAVPNDVFLSETSAMHIITGRNNSGKSTFLRSVALNTILAHTGCNVPAEFASFRLLKNVCTRFNTSDDINSQLSHHSKEMQEIGAILSATTLTSRRKEYPQSLVLVDELGRSTNTVDGFSIAYAVAERLASTPNVLTLFTTHFAALGSLQFSLPVVHGFHLATTTATAHGQPRLTAAQQAYHDQQREQRRQREAEKVAKDCNSDSAAAAVSQEIDDRPLPAFTYKVVEGELLDESYGIDTARAAGFSERVLASARSIRDALPARRLTSAEAFISKHHATSGVDGMGATRSRNAVRIAEKLSHLRGAMSKMDDAGLHQALRGLQAEVSAAGARRRAQSGSAREGCRRGSRG
jgi:DNA mismatch repair ATPase MutS